MLVSRPVLPVLEVLHATSAGSLCCVALSRCIGRLLCESAAHHAAALMCSSHRLAYLLCLRVDVTLVTVDTSLRDL